MYVPLHDHDEFSLLDGFSHPKDYLDECLRQGIKAFAITNHGNQYSWIYYAKLKKEEKYKDIKILYGVELYECFNIEEKDKDSKYFHLVAISKNERGRKALNEIVTTSNFKGFYFKPRIDLEHLKPYANDIIISTACLASKIAQESDYNKCVEYINEYKSIFPHFYLEMQSHKHSDQEYYNQKILQLSKDTNTPYIITTDSHAATKEELYYQGRHVQIAHDKDTMSEIYEGCYLQSEDEIHEIMDSQIGKENVDLGLSNTNIIADMCDVVEMPFQEPQLPTFPLPEGFSEDKEYLRYLVEEGWETRKINELIKEEIQVRKERMEYELSVINQMNFGGYFLIVWDFINWAKENNVMVGVGRGSGAGSIVCYLLGITDVDPIKYNLIFERFLNVERISMPDLDIDLSDRSKVVQYLIDKYGEERVCQVINYGYITPVVAIKDVGRVLKIPYKIIDKISKRFAYETFEECIENNPNVYEEFSSKSDEEFNEKLKELFKVASKLSGRLRQVSIHAGGVGIVDTKITDYMGMKLGTEGEQVIQVDKRTIEEIGIIKFDLLGVQTLNIVQQVVKDTGISEWDININNPKFFTDEKAFDLLCSGKTDGVFQVASFEMKSLLKRLQPRSLENLSALIALFRPDCLQFIEPYIHNKNNVGDISYIHNDMAEILDNTYGCMLYQEQLLDIVRKFGGRTYGGADKFRKGIGKKNKELVKQESGKLYEEILNQGYPQKVAYEISNDMSSKGGYLFNKSHSVAYAVLCLQTAYLKAHYPVYFYKALLNIKKSDNGAINRFIVDAQDFNVKILPPHINKSIGDFSVSDNSVLFGFEAIRGMGESFSNMIIEERNKNGKFVNLDNFLERINPSESQIVALTKSGAIPTKRKKEFLLKFAKNSFNKKEYSDVISLPTLSKLKEEWNIDTDIIKNKEERLRLYNEKRKVQYNKNQKLSFEKHMNNFIEKNLQDEEMWEFETLSVFLNNNPFEEIYDYITPFEEIENEEKCVIVGVVSKVTKKKDRNKNQFAYITLYSATGIIEITCWASQLSRYQDIIKKDNKLAILCSKRENKAFVSQIKTFEQWLNDTKIKTR